MPIVTIQVTREGTKPGTNSVTPEEKAALIKGASQLLLDVLNKPLESTFVVIDEVDTDNWGWGGLPALEYQAPARRGGNGVIRAEQQTVAGADMTDTNVRIGADQHLCRPPPRADRLHLAVCGRGLMRIAGRDRTGALRLHAADPGIDAAKWFSARGSGLSRRGESRRLSRRRA